MGYTVDPGAILQIQFEGRHAGQKVMTIMSWRYTGEASEDGPTLINEIEGQVIGAAGLFDQWLDCLSEDVIDCFRSYQWVNPVRYAYMSFVDDPLKTGQVAEPALPPNVSQAVTRRALLAGRRMVSTLKLPGVPASQVVNGVLTDAQQGRLSSFGQVSIQQMVLASGNIMVPIPYSVTGWGEAEVLILQHAQSTVRIMRRRTVGLGI